MIPITEIVTIPAGKLRVSLPAEATAEQTIQALNTICDAIFLNDATAEQLRLVLGRILVKVQRCVHRYPNVLRDSLFSGRPRRPTSPRCSIRCLNLPTDLFLGRKAL